VLEERNLLEINEKDDEEAAYSAVHGILYIIKKKNLLIEL